jgi:hypothetical protein
VEDQPVTLLQEIRDLLRRTVENQEQVLRANAESWSLYRKLARRQSIGMGLAIVFIVVLYYILLHK